MFTYSKTCLAFGLFLMLAGCATSEAPVSPNNDTRSNIKSVELFMSRASASTQDFEQFKLSSNTLYKECGPINRGRFAPLTQELGPIEPGKAQEILNMANDLSSYINSQHPSFDKPGTNKGFADPGQVFITIDGNSALEVKSSLDSVSNAKHPAETKVKKLIERMRGAAGGTLCGNQQFYGIAYSN